jgi:amicyanin
MVARSLRALAAVAALAGLLFVGSAAAYPARAGANNTVQIADFAFSPPTLTIVEGESVTWTNADPIVHTATSTSGSFDSGDLDPGESYSVTFATPGTYDYLCTPHPSMTGRIVVQAASAPTPAPTAAPSGGGSIPNVAMPPPAPSVSRLAGIVLLILGSLAAGRAVIRRRSRVRTR